MANLNVKTQFRAKHGTEKIRESDFQVEVEINGQLTGDFVDSIDYVNILDRLSAVIDSLRESYLDDIVGRGTIENVACLLMFRLQDISPFKITVRKNDTVEASVFHDEANWINYTPLLYFKLGSSKMVRRLYLDALVDFNKVLEFNPHLHEVINCRGRAYKHLRKFDLALEDHSRVIELNPQFGEAYRNRGNDHYYLGNFELMMSDFDRAIKLMPFSALAFNNRGFALQHFSRYQEAIRDHSKAIELDQSYAEAYSDRSKALRALGKNDLARSDEEQAKKLAPLQNRFNSEWKKITWPSLKEDGLKFLVPPD